MMDPQSRDPCYWTATLGAAPAYPALGTELSVDVAIVGAGIVGLMAAERLAREGRSVAVLEADRIGTQVTGRSSAKVTSQHGLMYSSLIDRFGADTAGLYARANEQALAHIASQVGEYGIDCGFERRPACVYAADAAGAAAVQAEAMAAVELGLPARLVDRIEAPVPVSSALCFDLQAQFHPGRFLCGLAQAVSRRARIFEHTRVVDITEGSLCTVHTAHGNKVRARDVIVATHMPIVPEGAYFARAFPFSHTVAAARLPADAPALPMCITAGEPSFSFRDHAGEDGRILLAVGPTYKTGDGAEQADSFQRLEAFLEQHFGVQSPDWRWTNLDYAPMDGLPFVGHAGTKSSHLYVAVGFNAWGITTGTAAGQLLADQIAGRPNEYAALFDATRLNPIKGAAEFVKGNLESAGHFIGDRLDLESLDQLDLAPGQARLARVGGQTMAAYCDEQGALHAVSGVCTHLGCLVDWNPTDRSWDCPCHGSRFEVDGKVLHGPATSPLKNQVGDF